MCGSFRVFLVYGTNVRLADFNVHSGEKDFRLYFSVVINIYGSVYNACVSVSLLR
jgi:hypothetical protein